MAERLWAVYLMRPTGAELMRVLDQVFRGADVTESLIPESRDAAYALTEAVKAWDVPG